MNSLRTYLEGENAPRLRPVYKLLPMPTMSMLASRVAGIFECIPASRVGLSRGLLGHCNPEMMGEFHRRFDIPEGVDKLDGKLGSSGARFSEA